MTQQLEHYITYSRRPCTACIIHKPLRMIPKGAITAQMLYHLFCSFFWWQRPAKGPSLFLFEQLLQCWTVEAIWLSIVSLRFCHDMGWCWAQWQIILNKWQYFPHPLRPSIPSSEAFNLGMLYLWNLRSTLWLGKSSTFHWQPEQLDFHGQNHPICEVQPHVSFSGRTTDDLACKIM